MRTVCFGQEGRPAVVLIHGGGLSWWNYRAAASLLEEDFRVVLPLLDGHAGSDRGFTSIEECADGIVAYIDEHLGGTAEAVCGLSLGGQTALEILSRRPDICRCAVIESASALPSGMTAALVGPSARMSYPLVRKKWFSRLQFRYLRMDGELFDDYYRDTCAVTRDDMAAFLTASVLYAPPASLSGTRAKVRVVCGQKETAVIRRSAGLIHGLIPGSTLEILPGLYHGEYSMKHPEQYVRDLREMIPRR
jgi:pimeloyl-ACP methyl ester carboxylesterase